MIFHHPFRRACRCHACRSYRAGFSAGYLRATADQERLAGLIASGFTVEQANRIESLVRRES